MSVIWFFSGGKDTRQLAKLLERHDKLTLEQEEVRKEIVEFYFSIRNLPKWVVQKNVNTRWTKRELNNMVRYLRRQLM